MVIRKQIRRYTRRVAVSNSSLIALGGEPRPMSRRVILDRPIRAGLNLMTAVPR